ncbi:MAG TPA: O-methyltransferase [Paludibacteraceae bacterium]|jgi:predicted O-methyltransferase YrrM|nr:O-methyltransferase [Paludibacteraceae bacterium]OPZ03395.1 MAG: putative O-methyltransferase [Bacteroidetes bacterium ADurb.BinA395]MBP8967106.1 O-methyltransferase [Paludibacteraceae bacterium]HOF98060.1 O-methyltransferase [Paludibacteraceae bacterium]HOJ65408.1 O-methyltransferase [Paludibacteraceae bacterium]
MSLEDYILQHSDSEPAYLTKISRDTHVKLLNPRMVSGHLQGRVLSMLCKMIQPHKALEIGTFTGYSALCIAEALTDEDVLHTIEIDDELEDLILENFAGSEHGHRIKLHIGNALEIIPTLNEVFDLVFIDADKREYTAYFEAVFPKLRNGGFILADNTLWNGKVVTEAKPNDRQTMEILRFNDLIASDDRIEKVILPLRDGLTIIRKK